MVDHCHYHPHEHTIFTTRLKKCNEITCQARRIWGGDYCLPAEWVCGGNYQCLNDNSDEDEGCKVF